jgi:hypothetical protein
MNDLRAVEGHLERMKPPSRQPINTRARQQHAVRRHPAEHSHAIGAADVREAAGEGRDDVPGGQRLSAEELELESLQSRLGAPLRQIEHTGDDRRAHFAERERLVAVDAAKVAAFGRIDDQMEVIVGHRRSDLRRQSVKPRRRGSLRFACRPAQQPVLLTLEFSATAIPFADTSIATAPLRPTIKSAAVRPVGAATARRAVGSGVDGASGVEASA